MMIEFCNLVMILAFAMAILLLLIVPVPMHNGIPAVCSTVEFNPDVTPETRKKCRELRATKY